MIKECLLEGRQPIKTRALRYDSLPSSKAVFEMSNGILYCPILKVGSTFLNRILVTSGSNGSLNSPFETRSRHGPTIHRLNRLHASSHDSIREVNQALKRSISFLAVRDPYTKLFSGYADKLFHPNYMFWRITGQKIQLLVRDDNETHEDDVLCGHDISFAEFVKYIIYAHEQGDRLNAHFVTLHEPCDPCLIEYDYILKIETFKEDVMFLLNVLNESFGTEIKFSNFEQETAIDNAKQHIKLSFATRKKYGEKCNIPNLSFLFRTWRYLQMNGKISKMVDLPIKSEKDAFEMTVENFTDIVSDVISRTENWTAVKMQRKEAFLQAYRSVDMLSLQKLQNIMEPDCRYFDYDCGLENFQSVRDSVKLDFDYFDAF